MSQSAYGDGLTGLVRVGPLGDLPGMSKLVKVHVLDVVTQTSWNIFRMCLAPSGVPVAVVNTLPVSCQCDPAASRSAAWSTCHSLSAPTGI